MSNCDPIATSIANAVTVSGVSRAFLYGEIQKGRLQIRKAGRRSLIEIVELKRWLASLPTSSSQHRAA